MTSLDIAELCGKPHNDILKAIRKMEPAWEKVQAGKFSLLQKSYDYNAYKRVKKYFFTHGLHGIVHFYKNLRKNVRFVGKFLYLCTLE